MENYGNDYAEEMNEDDVIANAIIGEVPEEVLNDMIKDGIIKK